MAFELAYFYGWTLDYIRSMTMYDLDRARDFMVKHNKQQSGGGQPNGGKRH